MKRYIVASVLILFAALPAAAQGVHSEEATLPSTWKAHAAEQLNRSLASHDDAIREKAMQLIIQVANGHEEVDLEPVVPALLEIYRTEPHRSHRMMALAAIHATGSAYGMDRLAELVNRERSAFVRKVTWLALADYKNKG